MNTTRATTSFLESNARVDTSNSPSPTGSAVGQTRTTRVNSTFVDYSPPPKRLDYGGNSELRQVAQVQPPIMPLKLAVIRGAVWFSDTFLSRLQASRIITSYTGSPDQVLRYLSIAPQTCDIVLYPVSQLRQQALDFGREVRRIREIHGSLPSPRTLIVSFVDQLPTTVAWFRRTSGTQYAHFTTEDEFVNVLRSMHVEILAARRTSQRLHLRLVHEGNPSGVGCVLGEQLVGTYASFRPGHEKELKECDSVLRFLNLMAVNRWISRTAGQLLQLMHRSPLYTPEGLDANVISLPSVKTYVHRSEQALVRIWQDENDGIEPPIVIRREPCGGKQVAYRLLCTCEVDHI